MSEEALIFEVGESGFDRYVIENSHKIPVLVEFMGVWSEPCVVMADIQGWRGRADPGGADTGRRIAGRAARVGGIP